MINLVIALLITLPIFGLWATYKLYKWHQFYGTRFLWGLFLASVVVDIAELPIAFLSARRLILGPNAPPIDYSGEILGFALIALESVFVYLVWRWRDLDQDMRIKRTGRQDESYGTNLPPKEGENKWQ